MKAFLKNYRQSPRKVRLVADLVRGKKVEKALYVLEYLTKSASQPVRRVIDMAVSDAKNNFNLSNPSDLFIKDIRVDEGVALKRYMPRARGRAARIKKRTSHIYVELATVPRKQEVSSVVSSHRDSSMSADQGSGEIDK